MRRRTMGFMGVIALAVAPLAMTQTPQETPVPERESSTVQTTTENRTVTGRVVQVDRDSLTVETANGERMRFSVARDLTEGPNPITVGSQVRVEYRGEQELQVVNVSRLSEPRPLDDEDLDEEIAEEVDELAEEVDEEVDELADNDNGSTAAAQADPDDELPGTASPLPLLVVTGLSLLAGGLGLSARRRL